MTDHPRSRSWVKTYRLGRLQLGWRIYRHAYAVHSDRWVIQPQITYDRKRRSK